MGETAAKTELVTPKRVSLPAGGFGQFCAGVCGREWEAEKLFWGK